MVYYGASKIVRKETVDDGTTGGKEILIDEHGNRWAYTYSTKETCGTGETIGTLENGMVYV